MIKRRKNSFIKDSINKEHCKKVISTVKMNIFIYFDFIRNCINVIFIIKSNL